MQLHAILLPVQAAVNSQFSENYLSAIRFLNVVNSKLELSYITEFLRKRKNSQNLVHLCMISANCLA